MAKVKTVKCQTCGRNAKPGTTHCGFHDPVMIAARADGNKKANAQPHPYATPPVSTPLVPLHQPLSANERAVLDGGRSYGSARNLAPLTTPETAWQAKVKQGGGRSGIVSYRVAQ